MRLRFLIATGAMAAVLAAVPATAGACSSLARVKSFQGHAHLGFDATASGDDGYSGTQTITLNRGAASLDIKLHRSTSGLGHVLFAGYARGGEMNVDDRFTDTYNSLSGQAQYSGPLEGPPPVLGAAFLLLNTHTCKYQVQVGFNVKTSFSGNLPEQFQPDQLAGGTAFSDRHPLPASLKLNGVVAPDAYDDCSNSFNTGHSCYTFSGGWTTDFEQLALCHAVSGSTCTSSNGFSFGTATFAWHLSPTFKKKKKK